MRASWGSNPHDFSSTCCRYHDIILSVEPKRKALYVIKAKLDTAEKKQKYAQAKLDEVQVGR